MTQYRKGTRAGEWDALICSWMAYQRAGGAPETTIGLRRAHLELLARDFPSGPSAITFDDLVEWLSRRSWKPNTRRSYRATLRAFWRWLLETGRVTSSPAHQLPPVKVPAARPRPTPEEQFRTALGDVRDERVKLGIMLAGMCGLRVGEIARTRTDHLERDLAGWTLRVTGKGGRVRLVPLPDVLATIIHERTPGWLFPSSHGGHLTAPYLGKLIARELPGSLTTHTLRHRCATVAYAGSKDIRAVQVLLGHAKPETTAIYTAVPDADVRAAMQHAAA